MTLTEEGILATPGMLSRWVRLGSGARAHYLTAGETGPAVILLHGGTLGSTAAAAWRHTAPFLGANGFRVYCPDMPAFGLSDMADEHRPTGLGSHVDFIHELTTALCLDRFHLAGNSLGCFNTVGYVVAHPERVISYALISGPLGDLVPLREQEALASNPPIPPYDGSRESMMRALEQLVHDRSSISDDLVTMACAMADRTRAAHAPWSETAFRVALDEDAFDPNACARLRTRGRLDAVRLPAVHLWGTEDSRNPVARGPAQEEALPNVPFVYVGGAGHEVQTDRPDVCNSVLLELFRDGRVHTAGG